jgi:N-acetylglucosamine-6-phosphate deacetylase
LAPGYIDAQINGAYGVDFSCRDQGDALYLKGIDRVSRTIVETGTTSYVPTIITQKREMYPKVSADRGMVWTYVDTRTMQLLPLLQPRSMEGCAHVLGYHAEGKRFGLRGHRHLLK